MQPFPKTANATNEYNAMYHSIIVQQRVCHFKDQASKWNIIKNNNFFSHGDIWPRMWRGWVPYRGGYFHELPESHCCVTRCRKSETQLCSCLLVYFWIFRIFYYLFGYLLLNPVQICLSQCFCWILVLQYFPDDYNIDELRTESKELWHLVMIQKIGLRQ